MNQDSTREARKKEKGQVAKTPRSTKKARRLSSPKGSVYVFGQIVHQCSINGQSESCKRKDQGPKALVL